MTGSPLQSVELPDAETRWALLERVAASAPLRRAARLQELLFYVGKRSLKEGSDRIHEQEIGSKVFGRPDSYDPGIDNIVRTNFYELRKRIEAYFDSEGSHEALIMEIPRGNYIPVFRYRAAKPEITANNPAETQASTFQSDDAIPEASRTTHQRRWMLAGLAIIALAIGYALFVWIKYHALDRQYSALHRSVYGWQYKPSVAGLWSEILNANPNTDVVISDASIGMVQAISQTTFPLRDYLSRAYVSQLQAEDLSPDTRAALNRILAWNLENPDEVRLARRILALDPLGQAIHLYDARNYMPDLIRRNNVILIGARRSNPWDELVESRTNFVVKYDSNGLITNRSPAAGELQTYTSTDLVDYCVVAYLPNPDNNGIVLLIEGAGAEATEGAGDFLLSEEQLSNFKKMLHVNTLPYFEVLLKVSSVRGTPLGATIEAYRAYPNLH
jgi:hypothetical protein